jgi:hypothetical protein
VLQEEELRCSGDPKFSHLSDDLHVEITAFAPPAEAHARIAYALAEVRRFLVPVSNHIYRWLLQEAVFMFSNRKFCMTDKLSLAWIRAHNIRSLQILSLSENDIVILNLKTTYR